MKIRNAFWESHYKSFKISEPSNFAKFVTNYVPNFDLIIELGCGNGRDSFTLADISKQYIGVDSSESAINSAKMRYSNSDCKYPQMEFVVKDFLKFDDLIDSSNLKTLLYSRFSLHSISEEDEIELITKFRLLQSGSFIALEVRTIYDPWFGVGLSVGRNAFHSDHYRRFIVPSELISKFREFSDIKCCVFGNNLAVHPSENPHVLRLIAEIK